MKIEDMYHDSTEQEWYERLISEGKTKEEAEAIILEEIAKQGFPGYRNVGYGTSGPTRLDDLPF